MDDVKRYKPVYLNEINSRVAEKSPKGNSLHFKTEHGHDLFCTYSLTALEKTHLPCNVESSSSWLGLGTFMVVLCNYIGSIISQMTICIMGSKKWKPHVFSKSEAGDKSATLSLGTLLDCCLNSPSTMFLHLYYSGYGGIAKLTSVHKSSHKPVTRSQV